MRSDGRPSRRRRLTTGPAGSGPITARWSTACCSGPGPGCPGRIRRNGTGSGRPCMSGIAADRRTAPGNASWPSCRSRPMPVILTAPWPAVWSGNGRWTSAPPPAGPTSTRSGPSTARRPTSRKRGRGACGGRWAGGAGALTGRLTTKVHLPADDRARPLTWLTPPGQRGDSPMPVPVLERLHVRRRGPGWPRRRPDRLRGDKGCSSRDDRVYLRLRGIKATIAELDDQPD